MDHRTLLPRLRGALTSLLLLAGCGGDAPMSGSNETGVGGGADDPASTDDDDDDDDDVDTGDDDDDDTGDDDDDADVDTGDDDDDDDPPAVTCSTDLEGPLAAMGVPGLSVAVVADGQVVCTAVAGLATVEDARLVEPDTPFTWASVSKTVTATAAMILVDDGVLGLDDDVSDHLSFTVDNPHCAGEPITVRQLLAHASSIIDDEDLYESLYTDGDSPIALGDFVEGYLVPGGTWYDADLNFDIDCPGEYGEYSNVAIGLLGHVVEAASGMAFDDFCRTRIFEPLGMDETSFHLANLDPDRVAMPYDGEPGAFEPVGHFGFPTFPDGLLRTSPAHLGRFLAMTAAGGEYDGVRILSETSVEQMLEVQFPELDDVQGLGWYYDYDVLVGHNGEDPGTSSQIFFNPDTGVGALLVVNGDWYDEQGDSPEADALMEALIAEGDG